MLNYYLKFYNFFLSLLWMAVLLMFFMNSGQLDYTNLILLNIAQGAALLEVFHALMKWVKSPVVTTFIQVSSRIFILILINFLFAHDFPEYFGLNGLHLAIFAWSFTEIVRYSYYLSLLYKKTIHLLTFSRYTFFIVLYPIGVIGELMILYTWATEYGISPDQWRIWFMGIITLLYIIFFPQMYLHMWKQRAQKL